MKSAFLPFGQVNQLVYFHPVPCNRISSLVTVNQLIPTKFGGLHYLSWEVGPHPNSHVKSLREFHAIPWGN